MGTPILLICLFLATQLHAGSIALKSSDTSTLAPTTPRNIIEETTTVSNFDVDAELNKIAGSCLNYLDHELLWNRLARYGVVQSHSDDLVKEAIVIIGITELRKALGFGPSPPLPADDYKYREPTDEELASAKTAEAYFDLKEKRMHKDPTRYYLYERYFPPAIAFLDERYPAIRTIYRRRFEEIRRNDEGVIDRKAVDRMIEGFIASYSRVHRATKQMLMKDSRCKSSPDDDGHISDFYYHINYE